MSKKATKALNNKYYVARYNASKVNDNLTSREKSAEVLNIDRTRLSRIELGTVVPYPEEVLSMSKAYDIPELLFRRLPYRKRDGEADKCGQP